MKSIVTQRITIVKEVVRKTFYYTNYTYLLPLNLGVSYLQGIIIFVFNINTGIVKLPRGVTFYPCRKLSLISNSLGLTCCVWFKCTYEVQDSIQHNISKKLCYSLDHHYKYVVVQFYSACVRFTTMSIVSSMSIE